MHIYMFDFRRRMAFHRFRIFLSLVLVFFRIVQTVVLDIMNFLNIILGSSAVVLALSPLDKPIVQWLRGQFLLLAKGRTILGKLS